MGWKDRKSGDVVRLQNSLHRVSDLLWTVNKRYHFEVCVCACELISQKTCLTKKKKKLEEKL